MRLSFTDDQSINKIKALRLLWWYLPNLNVYKLVSGIFYHEKAKDLELYLKKNFSILKNLNIIQRMLSSLGWG